MKNEDKNTMLRYGKCQNAPWQEWGAENIPSLTFHAWRWALKMPAAGRKCPACRRLASQRCRWDRWAGTYSYSNFWSLSIASSHFHLHGHAISHTRCHWHLTRLTAIYLGTYLRKPAPYRGSGTTFAPSGGGGASMPPSNAKNNGSSSFLLHETHEEKLSSPGRDIA